MIDLSSVANMGAMALQQWHDRHPEAQLSPRAIQSTLVRARLLVHPALDISLGKLLEPVLSSPGVYNEMLIGTTTNRGDRMRIGPAMQLLEPIFDPQYIPFHTRNPYVAGNIKYAVWRALFFSVVRLDLRYQHFGVPITHPEVNFFGEPLNGLQLSLQLGVTGHEDEADVVAAVRNAINSFEPGLHNRTSRRIPDDVAKQLARSVSLSHNVWGDRLYNPPL